MNAINFFPFSFGILSVPVIVWARAIEEMKMQGSSKLKWRHGTIPFWTKKNDGFLYLLTENWEEISFVSKKKWTKVRNYLKFWRFCAEQTAAGLIFEVEILCSDTFEVFGKHLVRKTLFWGESFGFCSNFLEDFDQFWYLTHNSINFLHVLNLIDISVAVKTESQPKQLWATPSELSCSLINHIKYRILLRFYSFAAVVQK